MSELTSSLDQPHHTAVVAVVGEYHDVDDWDQFVETLMVALNGLGVPCTVNLFVEHTADLMERAIADAHSKMGAGDRLDRMYRIIDRAEAGHYAGKRRDFGRGVAYLAAMLRTGDEEMDAPDDPLDELDDDEQGQQS